MTGMRIILPGTRQRFKMKIGIRKRASVSCLKAAKMHRILLSVFSCCASHRNHEAVTLDDHIHEKAFTLRNYRAVHGDNAIAVLCQRL